MLVGPSVLVARFEVLQAPAVSDPMRRTLAVPAPAALNVPSPTPAALPRTVITELLRLPKSPPAMLPVIFSVPIDRASTSAVSQVPAVIDLMLPSDPVSVAVIVELANVRPTV